MTAYRCVQRRRRAGRLARVLVVAALTAACTSAPEVAGPAVPPSVLGSGGSAGPSTSGSTGAPADEAGPTIAITSRNGAVEPSGKKVDVQVGQRVTLTVSSDVDDEIHVHLGEDGYQLPVRAGEPAVGHFVADQRGSFEVESHHLEKIIVILVVR